MEGRFVLGEGRVNALQLDIEQRQEVRLIASQRLEGGDAERIWLAADGVSTAVGM